MWWGRRGGDKVGEERHVAGISSEKKVIWKGNLEVYYSQAIGHGVSLRQTSNMGRCQFGNTSRDRSAETVKLHGQHSLDNQSGICDWSFWDYALGGLCEVGQDTKKPNKKP